MGDDGDRQIAGAVARSIIRWEEVSWDDEVEAQVLRDLALALQMSMEPIARNAVELREQRARLQARVISR
jgi:hypothetical protein